MEAVLNTQNLMPAKISVREHASSTEAKETDNRFVKLLKQQQDLMKQPEQLNDQKTNASQAEEGTVRGQKKETEKFVEEEEPETSTQEALQQAVLLQQAAVQMTGVVSEPQAEPEVKENPVVIMETAGEIIPDTREVVKTAPTPVLESAKATENLPQTKTEIPVSQPVEEVSELPKSEPKTEAEVPKTSAQTPKAEAEPVKPEAKMPEVKAEVSKTELPEPKAEEQVTEVPKQSEEVQTLQVQKETGEVQIQQTSSKEVQKEKEVNPGEGKTEKNQEEKAENAEESIFSAVEPTGKEKTETDAHSKQQENRNDSARIDIKKEILGVSDLGDSGQETIYPVESFRLFDNQPSFLNSKAGEIPLKTTPETLPTDLGKTLAAKLPGSTPGTLTVELEPASLGKLTIRLLYEGDRAAISIMASNPKTMEILNQKISEIAAILEEKTGQETIIYTQPPQQNEDEFEQRQGSGQNSREENQDKRQKENQPSDSFAQQLRLGLI